MFCIVADEEGAGHVDKIASGYTSLFLLIEIVEIRVSKHWVGRLNRLELAGGDVASLLSVGVTKKLCHISFPIFTCENSIVVEIPIEKGCNNWVVARRCALLAPAVLVRLGEGRCNSGDGQDQQQYRGGPPS